MFKICLASSIEYGAPVAWALFDKPPICKRSFVYGKVSSHSNNMPVAPISFTKGRN